MEVFNTTVNNISFRSILWQLISLVEENGEVYLIQHYVINFVSDLWMVCGFLRVLRFPLPIKLTATI
jgi:hypothetical protein